eukprot:scaffold62283_cov51-Prasinocladus_malaysianus.AAC.1
MPLEHSSESMLGCRVSLWISGRSLEVYTYTRRVKAGRRARDVVGIRRRGNRSGMEGTESLAIWDLVWLGSHSHLARSCELPTAGNRSRVSDVCGQAVPVERTW